MLQRYLHVVNVNPFSYGHFANGGSTIACTQEGEKVDEEEQKTFSGLNGSGGNRII